MTVAETNCIQNGEVLTIAQEDEQISVGLDLNSPTSGLRFEKGTKSVGRKVACASGTSIQ